MSEDETEQEDEFQAVTVVEAVNAQRTQVLFGERDQRVALETPEVVDGLAVMVKRLFEPLGVVRFDRPRARDEIQEWLAEEPDRGPLSDHDYERVEQDSILRQAIQTRVSHQQTVRNIQQQLRAALQSDAPMESLAALDEQLADEMAAFQPVSIDAIPVGDVSMEEEEHDAP